MAERLRGSHQEKPMRERVLARGKPIAGDDGRFGFALRRGLDEQPPEGPLVRCKRKRLRRQDRTRKGQEGKAAPVTAMSSRIGKSLKGESNPKSAAEGNRGRSGW